MSVGVCGCLRVSVHMCRCLLVSVGVCGCLWVSLFHHLISTCTEIMKFQ